MTTTTTTTTTATSRPFASTRQCLLILSIPLFMACFGAYTSLLMKQSSTSLDWSAIPLAPQSIDSTTTTSVPSTTMLMLNATSSRIISREFTPEALEKKDTGSSMSNVLVSSSRSGICNNYRGILHIRHGDEFAATGTLFFVYIINHILYAKQYNLLPWIHLDPSGVCYDDTVHGNVSRTVPLFGGGITSAQILRLQGTKRGRVCGKSSRAHAHPGDIRELSAKDKELNTSFTIYGNGIWASYFEPLFQQQTNYSWMANDPSCHNLPLVQIEPWLVSPGMHRCAEWAVRPWQVGGMPQRLSATYRKITLHEWFGDMRQRAHAAVKEYYRPQSWLEREIEEANPSNTKCMAMHIRMTDKGHGRTLIPLETYFPYAKAYADSTTEDHKIYLATDDSHVLIQMQELWPKRVVDRIMYRTNTLRSPGNATAVFDLHASVRHRTNTEALVEVYAMSRCQFMVHGYSAMAEAALYINYPTLQNHSVCLEYTGEAEQPVMTVSDFQSMVVASTT